MTKKTYVTKDWKKAVKDMEAGKSFEKAVEDVPRAVKLYPKQFKTTYVSRGQLDAIRRK